MSEVKIAHRRQPPSVQRVDRNPDRSAITRAWLAANTQFYGLLFVAILLLWNWFNLLSPGFTAIGDATASLVWILIDALLPLLLGSLGISLLRTSSDE